MNIYLDIDGVLLDKQGMVARGLEEFLEHILDKHNVFWLTTHCRGGACDALEHIGAKNDISAVCRENLKKIRMTDWNENKTEGIDFSQDFLWLDDFIFTSDRKVLEHHDALGNVIEVNLRENPDQLFEIMDMV